MTTRYQITKEPTAYLSGNTPRDLRIGDFVLGVRETPDSDGDILVQRRGSSAYSYVRLSALSVAPEDNLEPGTYEIVSRPFYVEDEEERRVTFDCLGLEAGDVVEVRDDFYPDSDGDAFVYGPDGKASHVAASLLRKVTAPEPATDAEPEILFDEVNYDETTLTVSAVSAAFVALGGSSANLATLISVARAIEAARS